jgi:hypothetical protein
MPEEGSCFSRPYAPAWCMLAGTAVGVPIGLATHASVIGVLGVLGLLIGTVIAHEGKRSSDHKGESGSNSRESRLRELEDLRSKSLISDDKYDHKRKEILSDL